MKLKSCLILLVNIYCTLFPVQLFSGTEIEVREPTPCYAYKVSPAPYTFFWSGNDEQLYLNITLEEGLEITSTSFGVVSDKIKDTLKGKLICEQLNKTTDSKWDTITLTLSIVNLKDSTEISYLIHQLSDKKFTLVGGQFKNPPIDFSKEPQVLPVEGEPGRYIISFNL